MAAFNFQPIVSADAVRNGANNDYQLRKAGLDSLFGGLGDFANSIIKLGQWKKTLDERDERLKQKNAWDAAYGKANDELNAIGAEQFDPNSVSRDQFNVAGNGATVQQDGSIMLNGQNISRNIQDPNKKYFYSTDGKNRLEWVPGQSKDVNNLFVSDGNGGYTNVGKSSAYNFDADRIENPEYQKALAGQKAYFDEDAYNKAVGEAKDKWTGEHNARLESAKGNVAKYGWNDMNNPAVNAAWDEYVRGGNSTLLTNLMNTYNADLARKAEAERLAGEKQLADEAAKNQKLNDLGRTFNTAIKTYVPLKTSADAEGLALAQSNVAAMENAISQMKELGADTSAYEQQMADAVGEKVADVQNRIAKVKASSAARRQKAMDKWNGMLNFQKAAYDNDFEQFYKDFKG